MGKEIKTIINKTIINNKIEFENNLTLCARIGFFTSVSYCRLIAKFKFITKIAEICDPYLIMIKQ